VARSASPRARPVEVFLSHSSKDRELADRVVALLRDVRVPVFYSPAHIHGAREWLKVIGAALERCDWFIVLLTPNAVDSMWVDRELQYALIEPRYRNRIIPLLGKPCNYEKLSWTLKLFEIIDFADFKAGSRKLLATWGLRAATA